MNSLFYCGVERKEIINNFIEKLDRYSEETSRPIYIIEKALGNEGKIDEYEYKEKIIVLIPKQKILLINLGKECEEFNNFVDDFIDDLEYLSKRYEYQKYIGRKRIWQDCIEIVQFEYIKDLEIREILRKYRIPVQNERIVELLISLLIGSINDINKIGAEVPETLLDKVKKKIVLFDGMQSRFIFEDIDKNIITIQGLAGTGKTELLLNKLREIYVGEKESKIVFTCHNKVLAQDMVYRIPQFFNFMKVEEQIEWNKRLWVFPSWGSQNMPNTGLYSYICWNYHLDFRRYSFTNTFDNVCKLAIEELEKKETIEKCFDYIFIDESQDFTDNFIKLCKMVTAKRIYIAGDIFQNVFDTDIKKSVSSDYLLNKCYRTDPKTLMLAHSIGMGLYEKPVIRWLDDDEWEACGYLPQRHDGKFLLKRMPLRRFEDIDSFGIMSIQIKSADIQVINQKVMECMDEIIEKNPTVEPHDIAIVLLGNNKINYNIADSLCLLIDERYDWESTRGYVSKVKEKNKVFISNTNNIKGLEFPFVICIETGVINDDIRKRNSIYMILTRSFLSSYFIVNSVNEQFIKIYEAAINYINKNGYMELREPGKTEKLLQAEKIRIAAQNRRKSVEDMINEVCNEYPQLSADERSELQRIVPKRAVERTENEVKAKTRRIIEAMIDEV